MSFVGELEHLPIVDVIQLLNSTRKSGTLCVKSSKGESQLVFAEGYIVGANHVNNSVRVGQVLVEMGAITKSELEDALTEQFNAGPDRKPLVATLLEGGKIDKGVAYKGLETLIEMTIVEVLTWTNGTFELDIEKITVCDEYRYFPEKLKEEICMNTQSVLMDALRIYDEKMRDGTLTEETFAALDIPLQEFDSGWTPPEITADILGLDDLDLLEKKIPDVFSGVKEKIEIKAIDPSEQHRKAISAELEGIPVEQQEKIYTLLTNLSGGDKDGESSFTTPLAVILFTRNGLFRHIATTLARHEGYLVFATDEQDTIDPIIDKAITRELTPVLIVEPPARHDQNTLSSEEILELLLQKRMKYPQIAIIQLVNSHNGHFSLRALQWGVRLLLPWPDKRNPNEDFAEELISLLETLRIYLATTFATPEQKALIQLRESILELDTLSDAPEVSFVILKFTAAVFERSMTFVVGKSELIAERGIGVQKRKSEGAFPMKFRIPLVDRSLFSKVIESGELYHGDTVDESIATNLYNEIGAPDSATIVLVPVKSMGRTVAVIYGDFGNRPASPVHIESLDILVHHAGLVLENTLYRRKFTQQAAPA